MDIELKLLNDARDKIVVIDTFKRWFPGIIVKVGDDISVIQSGHSNVCYIGVNMRIRSQLLGEYCMTEKSLKTPSSLIDKVISDETTRFNIISGMPIFATRREIIIAAERNSFSKWMYNVWYSKASSDDIDKLSRSTMYKLSRETGEWINMYRAELLQDATISFIRIIREATRYEKFALDIIEGLSDPYIDCLCKYHGYSKAD